MSTQEVLKKEPVTSNTVSEPSTKVEPPKDAKRELDDAEVEAIMGGTNAHNSPPTNGIVG